MSLGEEIRKLIDKYVDELTYEELKYLIELLKLEEKNKSKKKS
jgi:hypothetical protein